MSIYKRANKWQCDTCFYHIGCGDCRLNVESECGDGCFECWEPGTIGAMMEVTEEVVII